MRKFTTIFMAVVLCIAAITVLAFAAETKCPGGDSHDWSALVLVKVENGTKYYERSCACGATKPETVHTHTEEIIPAVEPACDQPGLTEGTKCSECGEILVAQQEIAPIAHTVEHVEAKTVICGDAENGNLEYWWCTVCGMAWLDEACVLSTNLNSVVVPVQPEHIIEHVEAKTVICGDAENGNLEYWYCTACGLAWLDEECILSTNLNSVVLPVQPEHAIEHVEGKTVVCGDAENGNLEYWYCTNCGLAWLDEACILSTNLNSVVLPAQPAHTVEHVEAKTVICGDAENGNLEYWWCPDCGMAWLDAECTLNTNLHSVIVPVQPEHIIEHVEAKTVVCGDAENGNLEYWYCTACGLAWLDEECILSTNLNSVVVPVQPEHTIEHVEEKTVICGDAENGNIEYWYCTVCGFAWLDEALTLNTNLNSVVVPVQPEHTIEHVEEKTVVCGDAENGNLEYWYCTVCGLAWLDEECILSTNLNSVVVPVQPEHTVEHVEAKTVVCGDAENGNIEYWYCTVCGFAWLDEALTLNTNLNSVVIPVQPEHTIEHVAAVEPTATENGNVEYWYCTVCGFAWLDEQLTLNTNLLSVVVPSLYEKHTIEHVEAKDSTCFELGNIEYWYCTVCGYAWLDEACTLNTNLHAVLLPLTHNVEHVEAKAPTCYELGNIEYWYCTECGYAWLDSFCTQNTNLKAVVLPVDHKIEYVAANASTCYELGNIEYWYCTECGYAWLDEACTLNTNLQAVKLPLAHNVEHVAAKDATCFELGNIEYWYCTVCGYAWLDEACTLNTNLQAVKLPLAHAVEHVEAKAATATENGNIEYWYCKECGYAWLDAACTKNTNLKAVILPATGEVTEPESPETGDNAIFFAVVLVAVAVAGVAVVTFKKREN